MNNSETNFENVLKGESKIEIVDKLENLRNQLNSKKSNETIYLKNIDKMIIKKSTKAEDSIKNLTK